MKYQIYLNKKTSIIIDRMAKNDGIKPATEIKKLVETIIQESVKAYEVLEKSFRERALKNENTNESKI